MNRSSGIDRRASIPWRDWLQMVDGLAYNENAENVAEAGNARMLFGEGRADVVRWAAARPLIHDPGAHWNYSSATTMLISDALIGGYQPLVMLAVYSALAAPVFLGRVFGRDRSPAGLLGRAMLGSFASATLFFVVTNLAVWLASGYYPRSAEGLLACYAAALPFFRYTLAGDLGYAMLLFGGHLALVRFVRPALACRAAAPTA